MFPPSPDSRHRIGTEIIHHFVVSALDTIVKTMKAYTDINEALK